MTTPRFDKLLSAWLRKNPVVAGEVRAVAVKHDDWCRYLKGDDCTCEPEFSHQSAPHKAGDRYEAYFVAAPPAENN